MLTAGVCGRRQLRVADYLFRSFSFTFLSPVNLHAAFIDRLNVKVNPAGLSNSLKTIVHHFMMLGESPGWPYLTTIHGDFAVFFKCGLPGDIMGMEQKRLSLAKFSSESVSEFVNPK